MLRLLAGSRIVRCLLIAAVLGVFPCQLGADDNGAATVITLVGQVSLLTDNGPWVLNVNDTVLPGKAIITGPDGYARLRVSDGSTFEVFQNSKTVFRRSPQNWSDLLDVIIGRVKVHIQKLGSQPNHNRVHTPTAVISVRGTIFDVKVEDDDVTFISVDEGQVAVLNRTAAGGERVLNPGESIRVFPGQPLAKKVDKGSAAQVALRAATQALYELIYRTPRGSAGGAGGGSGATLPGDTKKPAPPPAPPPPPPAPPPPPGANLLAAGPVALSMAPRSDSHLLTETAAQVSCGALAGIF